MQGFMHKMVTVGTDEGAGRGMSNPKTLVREERAGGLTHKKSSSNRGLTLKHRLRSVTNGERRYKPWWQKGQSR